ncbi:arsenate reductase ArsC [Streptomyces koyangensis]|uniref:arsenate-mycothiol transferase ArsC n=1 Tax=Streptomyces koyangensis TaxID=188770 RepID=UPI003452DB1E
MPPLADGRRPHGPPGGRARGISSAGTNPAAEVQPHVAQALLEACLAVTDAYPKPLTSAVVEAADYVITMGGGDACPIVPGRHYLDWPVADPDGAPIGVVRAILGDINARITDLLPALPDA